MRRRHSYDWTNGAWPLEEIYAHLIAAYLLFGEERYPEPVETLLALEFDPSLYKGGDPSQISFVVERAKNSFNSLVQFHRVMTGRCSIGI
ncbi:hypothetical protein DRP77_03895 [Candidatus Poribacteria bacterium]|nr:MAG: hypothetical protein DRP77_03895 [Candidatus Poribacteria bacterium]